MKASIDRFEGDVAVLDVDGREERRARASIAAEAREGDVIDLATGAVDSKATEALRARVKAARARLPKGKPGGFDL